MNVLRFFLIETAWILVCLVTSASAHDMPSDRVDRLLTVEFRPGTLSVRYQVRLGEFALLQDFRGLCDEEAVADRQSLYRAYAELLAPLDARGILGTIDFRPIEWETVAIKVLDEGHPAIEFNYVSNLPSAGSLDLYDSNYLGSEGSIEIVLGMHDETEITPIEQPQAKEDLMGSAWLTSPAQQERARKIRVEFKPRVRPIDRSPENSRDVSSREPSSTHPGGEDFPFFLVDGDLSFGWLFIALALGGLHSLQPGHGKSLIAGVVIRDRLRLKRFFTLVSSNFLGHAATIAGLAALLWFSELSNLASLNRILSLATSCLLTMIGGYRIGRCVGRRRDHGAVMIRLDHSAAFAIGLIPCWEVVILMIYSASTGRLVLGLELSSAYLLGTWLMLLAVCFAIVNLRELCRALLPIRSLSKLAEPFLGLGMTSIGVVMLFRTTTQGPW